MALVWTATASPAVQYINFGSASATFSSVAIGTASSDRFVIVTICQEAATQNVTAVTIGGSNATELVESTAAAYGAAIYGLLVTSNTTADIVVTFSDVVGHCGIHVGHITGANTTPTATATKSWGYDNDPQSLSSSPTIPTGGFGIVVIADSSGKTPSWSAATQDYYTDEASSNSLSICTAHSSTAGTWSPTVSGYAFAGTAMAAAVWEPAAGGGGASPGAIVPTITL